MRTWITYDQFGLLVGFGLTREKLGEIGISISTSGAPGALAGDPTVLTHGDVLSMAEEIGHYEAAAYTVDILRNCYAFAKDVPDDVLHAIAHDAAERLSDAADDDWTSCMDEAVEEAGYGTGRADEEDDSPDPV
jgi:hypothetical protein